MKRWLFVVSLPALVGCGTDPVPEVEIVEVAPTSIVPSDDANNDVTLTVHYADGDGDLGEGIAELHDCRAEALVTELALPPIANPEAVSEQVPIDGDLSLLVTDIAALDPGEPPGCSAFGQPAAGAAQLSLCVVLVDRAGHRSAPDCTDPINLAPP
jgi:hypothetical protein